MTSPPDGEAVAHFPAEVTSAGAARRFVASTLAAWGRSDLADVATLLVSELAGNVVLHAGTDLDVRVTRSGRCVRVEVHDRNPRLPDRKHYSTTSVTGRGLILVGELAERWGSDATGAGKVVWFELDEVPREAARAAAPEELNLEKWDDLIEMEPGRRPAPGPGTKARALRLAPRGPAGLRPRPVSAR